MGKQATTGPLEKILGAGILLVLGMIGAGIVLHQGELNPANQSLKPFGKESPQAFQSRPQPSSRLRMSLPEGLVALTPQERFEGDTLSEKINGKAELYLSAGFRSLITQRFGVQSSLDDWFEVFLYDMGEPRNAFAVFSLQRRDGADYSPEDPLVYRTANALFRARGPFYLEMIGSRPSEPMLAAMETLGEALLRENLGTSEAAPLPELDLFPLEDLDPQSLSLLPANAFGFDALDQVFVAKYVVGGKEVAAFLSKRKDAARAEGLASRYKAFLLENGGKPIQSPAGIPELRIVEILDTYIVIFTRGEFLAGISEAADRDSALRVATSLYERLGEAVR